MAGALLGAKDEICSVQSTEIVTRTTAGNHTIGRCIRVGKLQSCKVAKLERQSI